MINAPAMASVFTAGPWRRLGHRLIVTDHGAGLPICEAWSGEVGSGQADANENLIAAAPDLYCSLTDLLDQVKRAPVGNNAFLTGLASNALHAARNGRRRQPLPGNQPQ